MPDPPIDIARKIKDILQHTQPLPDEALAPIRHYRLTGNEIWGALDHIERAVSGSGQSHPLVGQHLGRLYGMALVTIIETFERFLKEAAAVCVDSLAPFVGDDRFNVFNIQGSTLASHFEARSLGRSLCESSTWLDCKEINERFRKLLADPYKVGETPNFYLFPRPDQKSRDGSSEFELMNLIWQIRHTVVHNVGVITQSDAVKLRLLTKEVIRAPQTLVSTREDLNYLKKFLDDRAENGNLRIGDRLAELLTTIHASAPTLLDPQAAADRLSELFQRPLTVAMMTGVVPS